MRGYICASAALLSGCGLNAGFLHDAASGNQHRYDMPVASEQFVRTTSGTASIGSILCLFPLDRGLFKQAMEALHEDAKLKPNQALENVRVDLDPVCYLVYGINNVTVSADIYEMTPSAPAVPLVAHATAVQGQAPPTTEAPTPNAEISPKPAKAVTKFTYEQLQQALVRIRSEAKSDHDAIVQPTDVAVRVLGPPQKQDGGSQSWWGRMAGTNACFVLRVSKSEGTSLSEAPEDGCKLDGGR